MSTVMITWPRNAPCLVIPASTIASCELVSHLGLTGMEFGPKLVENVQSKEL